MAPALVVATLLVAGCRRSEPAPEATAAARALADLVSPEWVQIYDPERAAGGYNLLFYKRRIPMLVDMNGRVAHAWPEVRARARIRLLEDGSLLTIALGRAVREVDWDGNLLWEYRLDERIPHHDVIRLANGNNLLLVTAAGGTDDLIEVDRQGREVWRWRAAEHLAERLAGAGSGDLTHINSVQELPDNPWHWAGDARFRPGNLLLSARNMDLVLLVDRATGEVVWSYDRELDHQHEALMIGPGMPGRGRILIFNNGYRNRFVYRRSSILEIDPSRDEVTWSYRADDFYSSTGGVEQPMPNGNVLIGSSRGGRVFEVTRDGDVVWQWAPPFDPRRPRRVAYDHCPQLAALRRPEETPVRPPAGYRFIDRDLYAVSSRGQRRKLRFDGRRLDVLKQNRGCTLVRLPSAAELHVGYGLARDRVRAAGHESYAVRFRVALEDDGGRELAVPLDDVVELGPDSWRWRKLDLAAWQYAEARLCLRTRPVDGEGDGAGLAFWSPPVLRPGGAQAADDEVDELTAEELEVRREHLRALGYVD